MASNKKDDTLDRLVRRYEQLKTDRYTWVGYWKKCADYMLPAQNEFWKDPRGSTQGDRRDQLIFDSTPVQAAMTFPTVIDYGVTPRNERWQRLTCSNPDLAKIQSVQSYYDKVTDVLFRMRYQMGSNFPNQKIESYLSMGVFGQGVMFIDEMIKGKFNMGIRYKTEHIGDLYLAENYSGQVDTVYRDIYLTGLQAKQQFGEENLPPKIQEDWKQNPDKKWLFIHVVEPNSDFEMGVPSTKGFKYYSCHFAWEDRVIVQEGGYRTFPYVIDRGMTSPRSVYAYSYGMIALADTQMLNEMSRTDIIATQRQAQPPLLLSDDGVLTKVNLKPNALNVGGLDSQGRELVRALQTNARPDVDESKMTQRRESIKEVFFVKIFQILQDNPQMTATQVLENIKEKSALTSPLLKVQEGLNFQTERELDILAHAHLLPAMPPELIEAHGHYETAYDSPLTRAQLSGEALGIQRSFEFLAQIQQLDPNAADMWDFDVAQRRLAKANFVPADVMRDEDQIAALRQSRAINQAATQAAGAVPGISSAIKDVSQAQLYQAQAGAK